MENYIQVMFWIGVFSTVVRLLIIGFSTYPRVEKSKSLGFDLLFFIVGAAFMIWAGLLYSGVQ